MPIYLAKYRPLISTEAGRRAIKRFNLLPYVDGSCRREPDFESKFPSITALCRGPLFAPKLKEEDEIIYITVKDFYGKTFKHWRIGARLKVVKRFESHFEAATWYRDQNENPPSNCMVANNPPLPLEKTSLDASNCLSGCGNASVTLEKWNDHYQKRADTIPVFLICNLIWKDLNHPKVLIDNAAIQILGSWERVRSRLPIEISKSELLAFEKIPALD